MGSSTAKACELIEDGKVPDPPKKKECICTTFMISSKTTRELVIQYMELKKVQDLITAEISKRNDQ